MTSLNRHWALVCALLLVGCTSSGNDDKPAASDSAFASLQQRGGMAMGVDQYASKHKFDITDDGGRISLQNDSDDSLAIAQIRTHLRLIQHTFAAGDFSAPGFVHAHEMPGTGVMTEKRNLITYSYRDIPRGGEVTLSTSDSSARKAIGEFLTAQRSEHHASGSGEHSQ